MPRADSFRANARPMPLAAPVITATCPFQLCGCACDCCRLSNAIAEQKRKVFDKENAPTCVKIRSRRRVPGHSHGHTRMTRFILAYGDTARDIRARMHAFNPRRRLSPCVAGSPVLSPEQQ